MPVYLISFLPAALVEGQRVAVDVSVVDESPALFSSVILSFTGEGPLFLRVDALENARSLESLTYLAWTESSSSWLSDSLIMSGFAVEVCEIVQKSAWKRMRITCLASGRRAATDLCQSGFEPRGRLIEGFCGPDLVRLELFLLFNIIFVNPIKLSEKLLPCFFLSRTSATERTLERVHSEITHRQNNTSLLIIIFKPLLSVPSPLRLLLHISVHGTRIRFGGYLVRVDPCQTTTVGRSCESVAQENTCETTRCSGLLLLGSTSTVLLTTNRAGNKDNLVGLDRDARVVKVVGGRGRRLVVWENGLHVPCA